MQVLHRVPGSVLWLLRFPPAAEPYLQREAQKYGIDTNRIVFGDKVACYIHMQYFTVIVTCKTTS